MLWYLEGGVLQLFSECTTWRRPQVLPAWCVRRVRRVRRVGVGGCSVWRGVQRGFQVRATTRWFNLECGSVQAYAPGTHPCQSSG